MKVTESKRKKRKARGNGLFPFLSVSLRRFPCLSFSLCLPFILCACAGTAPRTTADISPNRGAVIIAARIKTPDGLAYTGGVHLTLQGVGGGSLETYNFYLPARRTLLYQIAAGTYRIEAPKNFMGITLKTLPIVADGKKYFPAFPKSLSQLKPLVVKPEKTIVIGELDISATPATQESPRSVSIEFKHKTHDKRKLLAQIIRQMVDPEMPENVRKSEQSWINSIQKALIEVNQTTETPNPKP